MTAPVTEDMLTLGGRTFASRLFIGTGKYASVEQCRAAIRASGATVVTVAVRRVNLNDQSAGSLFAMLREEGVTLLPNTAACYTVDEAVRTARLGREAAGTDLVKLEVIGDPKTLFPDTEALVEAARVLVREGFFVLPYTNDDPIVARKLVDVGCPAVMPLGAPIGSGLGIRNPYNLRILMETVKVPVIVDAGVGTASDAAIAMELGADGVLMNTAIALARDPVRMATAMRLGVEAGRHAFLAGRMAARMYANASSPLDGTIAAAASPSTLAIE
jgi:thiazole synthase